MHAQCHKGDISCKPLNFKEMKIIRVLPRGLRLFQKWKPGVPFLGHSHHPKCAFSVAAANIVQGRRYDHFAPGGRSLL
jgi:hypothetical protein